MANAAGEWALTLIGGSVLSGPLLVSVSSCLAECRFWTIPGGEMLFRLFMLFTLFTLFIVFMLFMLFCVPVAWWTAEEQQSTLRITMLVGGFLNMNGEHWCDKVGRKGASYDHVVVFDFGSIGWGQKRVDSFTCSCLTFVGSRFMTWQGKCWQTALRPSK